MSAAFLSVVIPIRDEAPVIRALHRRLRTVLDRLASARGISAEIIAVDDGSRDGSLETLMDLSRRDPSLTVISLGRRMGQHEALVAGFCRVRGPLVISMDADLQNPPEEIPKIVDALEAGYDLVATRRVQRFDPLSRRAASRLANATSALLTRRFTDVPLHDIGCTLRGYSGDLARAVVREAGRPRARAPFVHGLALRLSSRVCEVDVAHAPRGHGRSRYGWAGLLRLYIRLLLTLSRGKSRAET